MRNTETRLLALAGIVALLAGCGQFFSWKVSGIPTALDTENLIRTAGAPLGIKLSLGGQGTNYSPSSFETEKHFHATVAQGTRGQLLTAYRAEVKRVIESLGASFDGTGTWASEGEFSNVSTFSYDYTWRGNAGIVRVYSFDASDGAVEVISLCYEHRK